MNQTKWILCKLISKLDRIPRYGRLYTLQGRSISPAKWTWQKRGWWGLNFLDRIDWLWPCIEESERRANAATRSARRRTDRGD